MDLFVFLLAVWAVAMAISIAVCADLMREPNRARKRGDMTRRAGCGRGAHMTDVEGPEARKDSPDRAGAAQAPGVWSAAQFGAAAWPHDGPIESRPSSSGSPGGEGLCVGAGR